MTAVIVFVLGSDSDLPQLEGATAALGELEVPFGVRILSAHRTPKEAQEFAEGARGAGVRAIIAGAGMAAHLAGVLAAHTSLPVLGVPMAGGALEGLDALYSTVQMPGGVPVATFGIGKAGAKNAALFAVRMLANDDEALRGRLEAWIADQGDRVRAKDAEVRKRYGG
ncbi:MAG: 5-(carboxyamino)imidazole ribonucleotide mutase [Planctomycetota bacterium]